jgi:hypothetical protein
VISHSELSGEHRVTAKTIIREILSGECTATEAAEIAAQSYGMTVVLNSAEKSMRKCF